MTQVRRQFIQKDFVISRSNDSFCKQSVSLCSTIESNSPRGMIQSFKKPSVRQNKQKSQLCKKFVQNGFCPYQKKYKFAHGLHELKKNSYANSKYKTKECGIFMNQGCCMYGNRCNFIHHTQQTTIKSTKSTKQSSLDFDFMEIKAAGKTYSRLLSLLQ